jgi:hypothetical protein
MRLDCVTKAALRAGPTTTINRALSPPLSVPLSADFAISLDRCSVSPVRRW